MRIKLEIISVEAGPVATNGYLIYDVETRKAVIIDAPLECTTYFKSLIEEKKLKVEAILLTHTHWDHTADCAPLQRLTSAKVYAHSKDQYRLTDPMNHTVIPLPFTIEGVDEVQSIDGASRLEFGKLKFDILFTPGHTEGGVCYVNHEEKVVFAGDTIFSHSIGRVDLPGGSREQLLNSIKEIVFSLPDSYKLLCGHGPYTTVGEEKLHNPFFIN